MHGGARRQAGAAQFVQGDQLVGQRGAGAAVFLADFRQQEAHLAEALPDFARHEALIAPGIVVRRHLVGDVATYLVAEGLDVGIHPGMLVQLGQHRLVLHESWRAPPVAACGKRA
ncbi:hypothetical protein D3C80_1844650 [compost metagenome]